METKHCPRCKLKVLVLISPGSGIQILVEAFPVRVAVARQCGEITRWVSGYVPHVCGDQR